MTSPRATTPPQAIDLRSKSAGLRAVAIFEGVKGVLILLLEFGVLELMHKDAGEVAEHAVRFLHLNPDRRMASALVDAAYKVTDAKLWAVAAAGLIDATVRFTVAYGLWHRLVWAEWFAMLGGALFLPWEIYGLVERQTPLRWILFLGNAAIVLYMLSIRIRATRGEPERMPVM